MSPRIPGAHGHTDRTLEKAAAEWASIKAALLEPAHKGACACAEPCRDRRYAGLWTCRLCAQPINPEVRS